MSREVEFIDEARRDMRRLDGSQRALVLNAIRKVQQNPTADGYGTPLGKRGGTNLAYLQEFDKRVPTACRTGPFVYAVGTCL